MLNVVAKRIQSARRRYRAWRHPVWRDGGATLDVAGERLRFKEARGGMYWWADQLRQRKHERKPLEEFAAALAPGQVVLDVGAWVGMYTMLASRRVGHGGHVYAFEPNPASRDLLDANLRQNGVDNVTVVPAAVVDRPGHAWLRRYRTAHSPETSVQPDGDIEVPAVSLASFCRENDISPGVIKIDVEGSESDVLADEAADVVRNARATIVEVHYSLLRDRGVDPARFLERLAGWGLEVRDLGRKSVYTGWVGLHPRSALHSASVSSAIARPDSPATE